VGQRSAHDASGALPTRPKGVVRPVCSQVPPLRRPRGGAAGSPLHRPKSTATTLSAVARRRGRLAASASTALHYWRGQGLGGARGERAAASANCGPSPFAGGRRAARRGTRPGRHLGESRKRGCARYPGGHLFRGRRHRRTGRPLTGLAARAVALGCCLHPSFTARYLHNRTSSNSKCSIARFAVCLL
jgi:hypothetical protein